MPENAEAVVLTAAERGFYRIFTSPAFCAQYAAFVEDRCFDDELSYGDARRIARRGYDLLRSLFPAWDVRMEIVPNLPSRAVIEKIHAWKPDLVSMGSHGRSAPERFLFGSVSRDVLLHTHANVRVSRGSRARAAGSPLRILIAYDGSQESEIAFEAALARDWPRGSVLRLMTVVDPKVAAASVFSLCPVRYWVRGEEDAPTAWIERMFLDQARRIEERGFLADSSAVQGEPRRVLLKEAEEWGADCIFAGCRGLTGRADAPAGSVSTALAVEARCPVEVVHRLWTESECCETALERHRDCMTR
jgi:nucleotide-binding universal stress UspA family protein